MNKPPENTTPRSKVVHPLHKLIADLEINYTLGKALENIGETRLKALGSDDQIKRLEAAKNYLDLEIVALRAKARLEAQSR